MSRIGGSDSFLPLNTRRVVWMFLITVGGSSAIAGVITFFVNPFWSNLLVSNCMGLSICVTQLVGGALTRSWVGVEVRVVVLLFLGVLFGLLVAGTALTLDPFYFFVEARYTGVIGVVAGSLALLVLAVHRYAETIRSVQAATVAKAELERLRAEAELKSIQTRVEPHFLFNTLANVSALVESESDRAKELLQKLTVFLDDALSFTSQDSILLADEMNVVQRYLEIQDVRLGARLNWETHVPSRLLHAHVTPLVVQSLVENAIKHGIEPAHEGGTIEIFITEEPQGHLAIRVVNSTGNVQSTSGRQGTGIANLSSLLALKYESQAAISLNHIGCNKVEALVRLPLVEAT